MFNPKYRIKLNAMHAVLKRARLNSAKSFS